MSEYKSLCGCEIHVAQWTAKRKVITQKRCSLHQSAGDLLAACKAVLARGCSCQSTESENWHSPGSVLAPACAMPIVKAAIAKAEGRS